MASITLKSSFKRLWRFAKNTWQAIQDDDCGGLAAEMAFYITLALVPAAVFLCSFFGWVGQKNQLAEEFITQLQPLMPPDLAGWFGDFTTRVVQSSSSDLALWSLLLTLWTASNGIGSIFKGVNRAYKLEPGRFEMVARHIWGTIFIFCFGAFLLICSNLVIWGDLFLTGLRHVAFVPEIWVKTFINLRILLPFGGLVLFSLLLYWILPWVRKQEIKWYQALPGTLFFVAVWAGTSQLFGFYLKQSGMGNELYSALGTLLILLIWLYAISFGLLVGAEINAQVINSTRR